MTSLFFAAPKIAEDMEPLSSTEKIRELLITLGLEVFKAKPSIVVFTNQPEGNALLNVQHHPHAFVLACVMDRKMNAERAQLIP
jgi:endonuclease III